MILWCLLFVLVVWTVIFRFRRRRMYQLASKVMPPKSEYPIIGIAHTLAGSNEDIMVSLQKLSYEAMGLQGTVRGWLNHILYFVMVNPTDLELVLKTCLEKDDLHRFIRKVTGYGGIFAPVPIWRRRRKILLPAFSPKILDNFVEVFSEQSEKLAGKLSDSESKGNFSVWPFLSAYTLDSVFETAMGVKINAQGNPNNSFLTSMNKVLNIICKRIFHLWLQPDWLFKFFPQYSEHQKCIKVLHNFTDEVIRRKRTELNIEKQNQPEVDHNFDLEDYQRKTFLDLLINLSGGEKGYTDVELREEVLTLTVAGTDTSAVAIGYTLMLLGKYPKIQDKVYEELYKIFGESNRPLVKEDLQNLKYLERVVKESLRLFPPVPFIIRKIQKDIKLSSGLVLPAGSGAVVSIWGCHRNPVFWGPDAECFDPDRFLPERFSLVKTGSYLPFSNGPRNCLGYQYALMSVKTALSAILRKYRVVGEPEPTLIPRIRVQLDIMMKAVNGYVISLEKRKHSDSVIQEQNN